MAAAKLEESQNHDVLVHKTVVTRPDIVVVASNDSGPKQQADLLCRRFN
jgi:hypothetical protein